MKIIIRRSRNDEGWKAMAPGSFTGLFGDNVFRDVEEVALAVHLEHPEAEVFVDDREHRKMSNGMVILMGDEDLQPVEFKQ